MQHETECFGSILKEKTMEEPTRAAWHRPSARRWRSPRGCQRGGSSSGGQLAQTALSAGTRCHAGETQPLIIQEHGSGLHTLLHSM